MGRLMGDFVARWRDEHKSSVVPRMMVSKVLACGARLETRVPAILFHASSGTNFAQDSQDCPEHDKVVGFSGLGCSLEMAMQGGIIR